jgi:putative Mn2+ efflux pump MntP
MISFLLLTTFTVSIDSFFCGFSLAFNRKNKYVIIPGIALTVFAMCLLTNYGAMALQHYLSQKITCLGGFILIFVGVYNIFKKNDQISTNGNIIKQSILIGFAVGLDGALANLSLSLMGLNSFFVPLLIAVMHGMMISLGILLANTKLVVSFNKIGFLPPLILILLGLYKVAGLFI